MGKVGGNGGESEHGKGREVTRRDCGMGRSGREVLKGE